MSHYRTVHRGDENFSAHCVFQSCGHANPFLTVEAITKHIRIHHTDLAGNIIYPCRERVHQEHTSGRPNQQNVVRDDGTDTHLSNEDTAQHNNRYYIHFILI